MTFQIKLTDKEELSRALGIQDARAFELSKQLCELRAKDKNTYASLETMLNKCQTVEELVLVASCWGSIISL